jgi:aldose 1-epimerase
MPRFLAMFRLSTIVAACLFLPTAVYSQASRYHAERVENTVVLTDAAAATVVSIVPSIGDLTFSMKVKGQDVLYFPFSSLAEFKARPSLSGIPLLAPWANRLDEPAFFANGKKYTFNTTLGNVRGATPIHGLVTANQYWELVEMKSDANAAWLTMRLDFYKHPDWMAQFPFAHSIELTQRLHDGVLQVETRITNLSTDPMPIAIGFHPYYQLTDSKREDWTINVAAAKSHYTLDDRKIPTGATTGVSEQFPHPDVAALKDYDLDDVYGDLQRNENGRAIFSVNGKHQKLQLEFGPKFIAAVIYSPNPNTPVPPPPAGTPPRPAQVRNFVCFEPMAGITDSINLAHAGKYTGQQTLQPGAVWQESFWIRPSGF